MGGFFSLLFSSSLKLSLSESLINRMFSILMYSRVQSLKIFLNQKGKVDRLLCIFEVKQRVKGQNTYRHQNEGSSFSMNLVALEFE